MCLWNGCVCAYDICDTFCYFFSLYWSHPTSEKDQPNSHFDSNFAWNNQKNTQTAVKKEKEQKRKYYWNFMWFIVIEWNVGQWLKFVRFELSIRWKYTEFLCGNRRHRHRRRRVKYNQREFCNPHSLFWNTKHKFIDLVNKKSMLISVSAMNKWQDLGTISANNTQQPHSS